MRDSAAPTGLRKFKALIPGTHVPGDKSIAPDGAGEKDRLNISSGEAIEGSLLRKRLLIYVPLGDQ